MKKIFQMGLVALVSVSMSETVMAQIGAPFIQKQAKTHSDSRHSLQACIINTIYLLYRIQKQLFGHRTTIIDMLIL